MIVVKPSLFLPLHKEISMAPGLVEKRSLPNSDFLELLLKGELIFAL